MRLPRSNLRKLAAYGCHVVVAGSAHLTQERQCVVDWGRSPGCHTELAERGEHRRSRLRLHAPRKADADPHRSFELWPAVPG
jgi:hypothetical protein